jgi:DeoR/GlpR family transcriptional regulator of sugar metabolism
MDNKPVQFFCLVKIPKSISQMLLSVLAVSRATAIRDLKELVSTGVLKRVGKGKSITYKQ